MSLQSTGDLFLTNFHFFTAETTVYDYMKTQNRPYSATDIMSNLHNAISKANVIKALASLEQKGLMTSKTYGKQVVYVIKQVI
jgi:26S proteasome regulatory subunit (ATPase 3-interacting protein)